jgi:hypothetical protein
VVTSVAAFLARAHAGEPQARLVYAAMANDLDPEARAAAEAQRIPAAQRRAWMEARTGRPWTAAQLAHLEQCTFVSIRRLLQAAGAWRGG